jgi:hypothetical protein
VAWERLLSKVVFLPLHSGVFHIASISDHLSPSRVGGGTKATTRTSSLSSFERWRMSWMISSATGNYLGLQKNIMSRQVHEKNQILI